MLAVALACMVPFAPIRPQQAWTAAGSPLVVEVLRDIPGATAHLMTHDGVGLAEPVPAPQGLLDVTAGMPEVATLDHAAYLQLINAEGRPVGPALVIEPALSRRVPVTETNHDDDRGDWTTIVGWRDEGADDLESPAAGAGRIEGAATPVAVPRDAAVIRSGFWLSGEQDVVLETDHGTLRIDLREDAAPNTARNFRDLCARGFYNNTTAHRIIPKGRGGRPFVVQGGDPTGEGSGGPGWWLPLEPSTLGHAFGVISMARADDPDSAGSQWFIALDRAECARLDGLYCAFGEVVEGRDAIVSMATTPLADTDYFSSRPVAPPVITSARTLPAPPRTPGSGRPDDRAQPPTTGPWEPH